MTKRTKQKRQKIYKATNSNTGTVRDCIKINGKFHDAITGQPIDDNWHVEPSGTVGGLILAVIIFIAASLAIEYLSRMPL